MAMEGIAMHKLIGTVGMGVEGKYGAPFVKKMI